MAIVLAALSAAGCTAETPAATTIVAAIVNGREASNRPNVCQLTALEADGSGFACTASLIAPNVVLTAAHCVEGYTEWRVMCPYAADRTTVHASLSSMAPSYPGSATVLQREHDGVEDPGSDLALVRLDSPLSETRVARFAFRQPQLMQRFTAYGRMLNGRLSNQINASPQQVVTDADSQWWRWAGVRNHVTDPGDSGGPIVDAETGDVVGVVASGIAGPCPTDSPCDRFAMLAPEPYWLRTTLAMFIQDVVIPMAPAGCDGAISCADCTSRESCGWCGGACVLGTVDGGGGCTRDDGTWSWTQDSCTASSGPETTHSVSVDVGCDSATSCAACTPLAGCGWCDGACVAGDANGGGSCTAADGTWTWTSSACADASAPTTDPCAAAADCAACTAITMCGFCNGACVSGTSTGGDTCTAAAGDWSWLSTECPDAAPTSDACSAATDCAACTEVPGCGWCDGTCVPGDYSGATSATCSAWGWYSFQCP